MKNKSIFFDKTYEDALALLKYAQHYIQQNAYKNAEDYQMAFLYQNTEMMRVTSRLTQIMSWLLAQKAVYNDEISLEEALALHKPPSDPICLENPSEDVLEKLDPTMRDLLDTSLKLYVRVSHLADLSEQSLEKPKT